jgi:hypothetical protein
MGVFLFIFFLFGFSLVIARMPLFAKSNLRISALLIIFYLKVVAGISITLIYTYYYKERSTSDIYKYFDDAQVISSAIRENPKVYIELVLGLNDDSPAHLSYTNKMRNWSPLDAQWLNYTKTKDTNYFNSNRIITRINAVLMLFSNGNIYIHVLFFSFISFLGLFYLYKQMLANGVKNNILVVLVIFALPSTLLWCSGALKDTLVLALLNIFMYVLLKKVNFYAYFIDLMLLLFLLYFIVITKYYVAIALFPVLSGFMVKRLFKLSALKSYLFSITLLILFAFIMPVIFPAADIWQMLIDKREEALKTAIWAEANHQIFYHTISNTFIELIINVPIAIFNGIFKPFIWEAGKSPFILLSGIENLILACLLILCLLKIKVDNFKKEIVLFYLIFSLSAAFIIGFTTPVTGGLVRYKTIFIIYFLLACIQLTELKLIIPKMINRIIFRES